MLGERGATYVDGDRMTQQKIIRTRPAKDALASFAGPLLIAASMALTVLGGWYTDVRRPLPNPLQPVAGLRWWFTPVERNAFMRLPAVTGDLYAVDATDDGQVIWAVGEQGLIVGTTDGGRTWRRGRIVPAESNAPAPPATERKPAAAAFNFIDAINPVAAAQAGGEPGKQEPNVAANAPLRPASSVTPRGKIDQEKVDPAQTQAPLSNQTDEYMTPKEAMGKWAQEYRLWYTSLLTSITVIDARRAVARSQLGDALLTQDGGATWIPQENAENYASNEASQGSKVLRDGRLLAVGQGGVLRSSSDNGEHWTPLTARRGIFVDLGMDDGGRGVIVGVVGTLLVTSDGGKTWVPRNSGVEQDLDDVRFVGPGITASVQDLGRSTRFVVSADGGRTWQVTTTPLLNPKNLPTFSNQTIAIRAELCADVVTSIF